MALTSRHVRTAVALAGALAAFRAIAGAGQVGIVRRAAGIPENAEGLGSFVNGTQALVTPMLVMTVAIVPLVFIAGAVALMLGSRRGMTIIIAALGVLLLLGSVTGLVA
jgi:hypothetical protein